MEHILYGIGILLICFGVVKIVAALIAKKKG